MGGLSAPGAAAAAKGFPTLPCAWLPNDFANGLDVVLSDKGRASALLKGDFVANTSGVGIAVPNPPGDGDADAAPKLFDPPLAPKGDDILGSAAISKGLPVAPSCMPCWWAALALRWNVTNAPMAMNPQRSSNKPMWMLLSLMGCRSYLSASSSSSASVATTEKAAR
jgi:hypothetical protein